MLNAEATTKKKFILKPKDSNYSSFELRHASSGIQTTAPLIAMMNYYAQAFDFKLAQKRSIIDLLFEKNLTTQYRPKWNLQICQNMYTYI